MSLRERNGRLGHRDRIWRHGYRDRIVVAGMADVEGAIECVFTGIRRGGLRCCVFWSYIWEAKYSNKFPAVVTSCNMLKRSLQRRDVESWPVLKEVYFRDGFSAVEMTERPFLQKVGMQLTKL